MNEIIVKLGRPQQLNGKEYTEIEMDFTPLKGKDVRELVGAFNNLYREYIPVATVDMRFQAMVAGVASKINPMDLEQLDAPDYLKVCAAARDFLTGSG